jgi:hypothetical protein
MRAHSDSFVAELPLRTSAADERALAVRLDAARHIYNAVLGECLRRLALMRESRDWQRARATPKKAERSALFRVVLQRFDFKSSMADRFAIACKNSCWIGDHLSSNETQKVALRAFQERFCPTVEQPWRELRRLERAMDRSRRATNPGNFDRRGRAKKGKKKWNRSRRYQRLAEKRRERERCLAAERRRAHGELANRILAQGTTIKTEKLSYRAFQRCFGRSAKVRGAGMLVAELRRKAAAAGGAVIEFSPHQTRLSQFDHATGTYAKKPLGQRVHVLGDGSGEVQRDLYSAFLALRCEGRARCSERGDSVPGCETAPATGGIGCAARTRERGGVPPPPRARARRSGSPVEERRNRSRGRRRRSRRARAPESDGRDDARASAPPLKTPRIHPWGGLAKETPG